MYKKQAYFMMIILLSCYSSFVKADWQNLLSISMQVESFIDNYNYESPYPARVKLAQIDQRLKLKACLEPLEINFTNSQKVMGNTSLSIQCKTPVKWQLHLPVRIDIYDDIALNKSAILKGQTIDVNNIHYHKKNITNLHQGFFKKTDSLDRLQAKRNLTPNSILNASNIAPKLLVVSGQQVTILLKINGLQIKSTGKALQSASLGQTIKVKNTQSNKIVEGVVSSEGQVNVRL